MNSSKIKLGTPNPEVSIIIPCFNEQATVGILLNAIYQQSFPKEKMEIIVADGISTDNTVDEIVKFRDDNPGIQIRIVENHKRNIPNGLNLAISAASGEFIVRLDAHSVPSKDYIARCVKLLKEGRGDNIGGIWRIQPYRDDWIARSIAVAASHPIAVGDARYRIGGEPQAVDTVPFGSFKKSIFQQIGTFDEKLLANEDYEFNARIRENGGIIWFDPKIASDYFARSDYCALAKQYWRYGYWKFRMLVRYPKTFRWRQLAGLFVLSLLVFGILSIWFQIIRLFFFMGVSLYITTLLYFAIKKAITDKEFSLIIGFPIAVGIMHFAWGTAFLWSIFEYFKNLHKKMVKID